MKPKKHRGPGRPPLPKSQKIMARITVWMRVGELARIEAEAKRRGITAAALLLAPWIKREGE